MAQIIHDIRNIVDFDSTEPEFEKLLKYYIWGGRDSFLLRNKMTELFAAQNQNIASLEPELKNWPSFIELCRKLLDSPADIQDCIFPIRELGFRSVMDKEKNKEEYNSDLINSNKRIRQFSLSMAKYLVSAVNLPKDFPEHLANSFNELR
jgi:hypothetical protein